MSREETGKNFLEHHGVKGMKWGERRAAKKAWKSQARSGETASKVYNEAARSFNRVLPKLNKDPAFADMGTNRSTRRQYDAVVQTIFNQHLAQASLHNTMNAAGDRAFIYQMTSDGMHMRATEVKRVQHADDSPPEFTLRRDKNGFVISCFMGESSMAQTATVGETFLDHHGIKGMKWGQRRSRKQLAREASAASGKHVKNMSDQELRTIVNRINMERQYAQLTSSPKGRSTVQRALAAGATVNAVIAFSRSPAGRAISSALSSSVNTSSAVSTIGRTVGVSRR